LCKFTALLTFGFLECGSPGSVFIVNSFPPGKRALVQKKHSTSTPVHGCVEIKVAGVHENRTHPGRLYHPTLDLKSRRHTSTYPLPHFRDFIQKIPNFNINHNKVLAPYAQQTREKIIFKHIKRNHKETASLSLRTFLLKPLKTL